MNLNQITIPLSNVTKSVQFYQKLGLELIVFSANHYARFICDNNVTFSIHQVDELSKGNEIWVYFEKNNLDEYINNLIKNGFIFIELPNDKPWLCCEARLRDLNQNLIILFYAEENRLNSPWKIKK